MDENFELDEVPVAKWRSVRWKKRAAVFLSVLCCVNLALWIVALAYNVTSIARIEETVAQLAEQRSFSKQPLTSAQRQQSTGKDMEESIDGLVNSQSIGERNELKQRVETLTHEVEKTREKLAALKRLHQNFNQFWSSLHRKIMEQEKSTLPSEKLNTISTQAPGRSNAEWDSETMAVENENMTIDGSRQPLSQRIASENDFNDTGDGNILPVPESIITLLACREGPQGVKGEPGANGFSGAKGDAGVRGERGTPGIGGPKGQAGLPGMSGFSGPKGETGERGLPGMSGRKGNAGEHGFPGLEGLTGIPGRDGMKGSTGAPGLPGMDGAKGSTGERGFPGTVGMKGSPGERGSTIVGAKGDSGEIGMPGAPGHKGDAGERGLPGMDGLKGSMGERGSSGARGLKGEPGEPVLAG